MKKCRMILVVSVCLLMICGMSMAASYNFTISPPFSTSLKFTPEPCAVSGGRPYVKPKVYAVPTTYFLTPDKNTNHVAANILSGISSPGTNYFTYKSGYGGSGQSYYLGGCPTNTSFGLYNVYGDYSS